MKIALILFFSLFCSTCFGSMEDCYKSTCKVIRKTDSEDTYTGGMGSGVVFKQTDKTLLILSAGHVTASEKEVNIKFYGDGFESPTLEGEVVYSKYKRGTLEDISIIEVKKSDFGKYKLPTIISLASAIDSLDKSYIINAGCAKGLWPTAMLGKIVYVDKDCFRYRPKPVQGRSGSLISDKEGNSILGIVLWDDGTCLPYWKINEEIKIYDSIKKN